MTAKEILAKLVSFDVLSKQNNSAFVEIFQLSQELTFLLKFCTRNISETLSDGFEWKNLNI